MHGRSFCGRQRPWHALDRSPAGAHMQLSVYPFAVRVRFVLARRRLSVPLPLVTPPLYIFCWISLRIYRLKPIEAVQRSTEDFWTLVPPLLPDIFDPGYLKRVLLNSKRYFVWKLLFFRRICNQNGSLDRNASLSTQDDDSYSQQGYFSGDYWFLRFMRPCKVRIILLFEQWSPACPKN